MDAIIAAGISALGAVVVCVITQIVLANRQTDALRADTREQTTLINGQINVINVKLTALSERVEKHNQVIERVYSLEEKSSVQEEKLRVASHRIDDLERKGA
jgi:uncharacterized protein YajQ (UPF0234 family)